jgi:holo-[acyl-carrier-protein] synthase
MEEKIREIVSVFIKVQAAQIAESTPIDRTALGSSILLHRMYARLGEEGVVVGDYGNIKVFGDLMRLQGGTGGIPVSFSVTHTQEGEKTATPGIGIDIEEVAALPRVADLRKEAFYTRNFTSAEIAYCILQADPYSSLTGLFAVKEAIVKADGQFRSRPFQTMEISHTAEGRPVFPGFGLSISHAGGMAVAVAVRGGAGAAAQEALQAFGSQSPVPAGKSASTGWITWMALLLAAAALLVALKH